jgi:hypothetical protein
LIEDLYTSVRDRGGLANFAGKSIFFLLFSAKFAKKEP